VPDIHDAFTRAVAALEEGVVALCWENGQPLIAHVDAPELMFRMTPLLPDGATVPHVVPDAWRARITPAVVASYFNARCISYEAEPGWGAHLPFGEIREDGDELDVTTFIPAKLPLVDPLRDTAGLQDEHYFRLTVGKEGEWGTILTAWENLDGFLGTTTPGQAWLDRRTAQVVMPGDRVWWEVRGWRDAGDGNRYLAMGSRPIGVTVYLGWPAYIIAAAGKTTRCPQCRGHNDPRGPLLSGVRLRSRPRGRAQESKSCLVGTDRPTGRVTCADPRGPESWVES
jgi:hypothetical protein